MDFDRMLDYCMGLELNNNRTWFHENHKQYEDAKADFESLLDGLKFTVANTASGLDDVVLNDAKKMMFRIPRDVRVYRNAPPYNPSFRAYVAAGKRTILPPGYFIMIAPGNRSHFGTGVYAEENALTVKIRDFIYENDEEICGIIKNNGLNIEGVKLKKVPAVYERNSSASELLKHKNWYAVRYFDDSELKDFDSFLAEIESEIKKMEPFRKFMIKAMTGIE